MSFTLAQLVWAVRGNKLGITAETSASLVLALAEQLALAPRVLALDKVALTQSGQLFFDEGVATSARAADRALRLLLGELLLHTSGEHPALVRCAQGDAEGLEALCAALLKALVPLNRSAAKRGLSRLHRRLEHIDPPREVSIELASRAPQFEPRSNPPESATAQAVPPAVQPLSAELLSAQAIEALPELDAFLVEIDDVVHLDHAPCEQSLIPCYEATPVVLATPVVDARPRHQVVMQPLAPVSSEWTLPMLPPVAERTPFLGSMTVALHAQALEGRLAHAALQQHFEAADSAGRDAASGSAFDESSELSTPLRPTSVSVPPAVDALIFGRFKAQRSEASDLLAGFELESKVSDHKVAVALRRCVGLRMLDGEASCTPPPVGWLVPLSTTAC